MSPNPIVLSNPILDVSLDPKAGALCVADKRVPHPYAYAPSDEMVIVGAERNSERAARLTLLHAPSGNQFHALVALSGSKPEFSVEISTDAEEMPDAASFPPPLRCEKGDWLVVPMNEGILYPVDDPAVAPPRRLSAYGGHGGLSMPWFGVTNMERGVAAIVETPDDMAAVFGRDEAKRLFVAPVWEPSKGQLRYPRKITYVFFDRGGYVAQAKAYRQRVVAAGRFKSLQEKRAENPNVDLLIGAPDVWTSGIDPVETAKALHEAGVERLLFCFLGSAVQNRSRAAEVNAIEALGFLVTRYDSYRTAYPVGKPEQAPRHFDTPDRIAKRPDGTLRSGWLIKRKDAQWPGYEVCSVEQLKEAAQNIPQDLAITKYQGRFIDTTTAAALMECYDEKHPLARSDDKQNKTCLLEFVSKDCGLIAGSETGQDWAAPVVHYFEGMMSLCPYRVPDSGRDMFQYKEPTPDLLNFQVGPRYRAPLWELVYHDSVVAVWYWGDGSNKQPELWDRRDLWNILYGTPPLWMIDNEKWPKEKDRCVKSYNDVCPAVRKTAYQEMLKHEFVTEDHTVQRTTFSSGVRTTVNFGEKPFKTESGKLVPPMGHLLE